MERCTLKEKSWAKKTGGVKLGVMEAREMVNERELRVKKRSSCKWWLSWKNLKVGAHRMKKELRGRERGAQREEHELERERVGLRGDSGSIQIDYMPGSCMIIILTWMKQGMSFVLFETFIPFLALILLTRDLYKYDTVPYREQSPAEIQVSFTFPHRKAVFPITIWQIPRGFRDAAATWPPSSEIVGRGAESDQ